MFPDVLPSFRSDSGVRPNCYNRDGFNVTNLTQAGYFVFYPDIVYEIGKTGQFAKDCVLAAVDEVLASGMIDPAKLALQGHSQGLSDVLHPDTEQQICLWSSRIGLDGFDQPLTLGQQQLSGHRVFQDGTRPDPYG